MANNGPLPVNHENHPTPPSRRDPDATRQPVVEPPPEPSNQPDGTGEPDEIEGDEDIDPGVPSVPEVDDPRSNRGTRR